MKFIFITLFLLACKVVLCQSNQLEEVGSLIVKERYQEAIETINFKLDTVDINDSLYIHLLYLRASLFAKLSNYENAKKDWKELIRKKPDNTSYYNGLAFAHWNLKEYKEAFETTTKAFKIDSTDILTLSNLSYYLAEEGLFEECIKYATIGLQGKNLEEREQGLLYSNRAFGYYGLKNYTQAVEDANASIKVHSNNSFPYFFRALAKIELNDFEGVCDDLKKSKSLGAINMTKEWIEVYCKY